MSELNLVDSKTGELIGSLDMQMAEDIVTLRRPNLKLLRLLTFWLIYVDSKDDDE